MALLVRVVLVLLGILAVLALGVVDVMVGPGRPTPITARGLQA
jgi:hypothetical protein